MPLIQSRVCARRATALSSISKPSLRAHPSWSNNVLPGRRRYAAQAQAVSEARDYLRTPQSIEDIRLKNEFETNRNVRDYLRKWQQITPNDLDPIRYSGINHTDTPSIPGQPLRWVGNMLNQSDSIVAEDVEQGLDDDFDDFEYMDTDERAATDYLEPGDLVAICLSDETLRLAIYVRAVEKELQFYTTSGTWQVVGLRLVDFVVKGFTTPDAVSGLHEWFPTTRPQVSNAMQAIAEGGVPREAGAHLLRMMDEFDSEVHELYRANSTRFDHLYHIVADEKQNRVMTLEELACAVLEIAPDQMNDVIRYTVHRATLKFPMLIDHHRGSFITTEHYVIRPLPIAKLVETVVTWYHEHQTAVVRGVTNRKTIDLRNHPMQRFLQKAQRMIRLSRKIRSPTMLHILGPSSQRFTAGEDDDPLVYREVPTEPFTDEEKQIIKFLLYWHLYDAQDPTMRSAGSYIMRSTGMYSVLKSNATTIVLFLQELGVYTPWENSHLLDLDMGLPGHGSGGDEKWNQVLEACENLSFTDKMAGMRRDWGDLPVYCVDSPQARDLDDGVSLERIPGSDDEYWLRVHVANPTAFVNHDHPSMQYAADRYKAIYVPEAAYTMLPPSLAREHFSLAPGRATLTISARMNIKGEVLETDMTNGVIHNVIHISADKLPAILGQVVSEIRNPQRFQVGGPFSAPLETTESFRRPEHAFSSEEIDTFRTLRQMMLGVHKWRVENGALTMAMGHNPRVTLSVGYREPVRSTMDIDTGRYLLGDPIIRLESKEMDPYDVPDMTKVDLTSQIMGFAGWIAARWCADRNIPIVYEGTYYHPESGRLTLENIREYGGKGFFELEAPRALRSSRPVPHTTLGWDAYCKSTSPLRRFQDIIVHYQIEAALRFEHTHKRRFDALEDKDSTLPFTADGIDKWISQSQWKIKRLFRIERGSKYFWATMAMFRAFYFGECELPKTFRCHVTRQLNENTYAFVLPDFGVRGFMENVPPEVNSQISMLCLVEAKLVRVSPTKSTVTMEAIRVIQPYERRGEWA